eukprot:scaffold304053_cov27-Tisochrysis_lutea.AAC.1
MVIEGNPTDAQRLRWQGLPALLGHQTTTILAGRPLFICARRCAPSSYAWSSWSIRMSTLAFRACDSTAANLPPLAPFKL